MSALEDILQKIEALKVLIMDEQQRVGYSVALEDAHVSLDCAWTSIVKELKA